MDFFSMIRAIGAGPAPSLNRTELPNGITVSTVDSFDAGPETALITPEQGTRVVERYTSKAAAERGHKQWVSTASKLSNGDKITDIGYGEEVEAEVYTLSGLRSDAVTPLSPDGSQAPDPSS